MKTWLLVALTFLTSTPAWATLYTPANGEAAYVLFTTPLACGDIVELSAGVTYARNVLANQWLVKSSGDCSANPIIVRSTQYASITTKVNCWDKTCQDAWVTTNASRFAKIDTGTREAFIVDPTTNGLKFIGIEWFSHGDTSLYTADLIAVGVYGIGGSGGSTSAQKLATKNIEFDRNFIHPWEVSSSQLTALVDYRTSGRGVHWAGDGLTFKNSDCRGFAGFFYPSPSATVSVGPSPALSGTTATLTAGGGALLSTGRALTWDGAVAPTHANSETIQITNITGDVITYTRVSTSDGPSNNQPIAAGYKIGNAPVIDAYCVYGDGTPNKNWTVQNNFLEAQTMTVFTGGGSAVTDNSATLSSGATATQATFSNVTNLVVGDLVAIKVPTFFVPPSSDHGSQYKVAKVTNIAGFVVTYAGDGIVPLDEAPLTPGDALWRGFNVEAAAVKDNFFWKVNQSGGKKGHLEFKSCLFCTIEHNVFDGEWPSDVAYTPHNQDGKQPWTRVSDTTLKNNLLKNQSRFATMSLSDPEYTSERGSNLLAENNLSIGGCNDSHTMSIDVSKGDTVTYRHNTVIENCSTGTNSFIFTSGSKITGFVLKDNIGWTGNAAGKNCQVAPNTSVACWPGIVQDHNVLVNNTADGPMSDAAVLALNPNDSIAHTVTDVGFVNVAGGDWGLAASSPYKAGNAKPASDGTDVGVNCAQLPGGACTGGSVPGAASDLSATAGNAQVILSWTSISTATSYNIKRGLSPGSEVTIATSGVAGYTDFTVSNGTSYFYVISGVNSTGQGANSNEVAATPSAGGGAPSPSKLPLPVGIVACASQAPAGTPLVEPVITLKVCHGGKGVTGWAGLLDAARVPLTLTPDPAVYADGLTQFTGPLAVVAGVHTVQILPIYGPAGDGPASVPFALTVLPLKTAPVNVRAQ